MNAVLNVGSKVRLALHLDRGRIEGEPEWQVYPVGDSFDPENPEDSEGLLIHPQPASVAGLSPDPFCAIAEAVEPGQYEVAVACKVRDEAEVLSIIFSIQVYREGVIGLECCSSATRYV